MKTWLITGGTDGIGKGLALLKQGHRVIVSGSTPAKGDVFLREANAGDRAIFLQADLSRVSENLRLIDEVSARVDRLDGLILCAQAQKFTSIYAETGDGFEFTFALYYLSRFVLSTGFVPLLAKSDAPVILNVCAPGMSGAVRWDDLQHRQGYTRIKAMLHGSRLNDLLGAGFADHTPDSRIRYILYNPGAVRTPGATGAFEQPLIKLAVRALYQVIALPVEKAILPVLELLTTPPEARFSAFMRRKPVNLAVPEFSRESAARLWTQTEAMLSATLAEHSAP